MMGRITIWPFRTTGVSLIVCIPKTADWGRFMIGCSVVKFEPIGQGQVRSRMTHRALLSRESIYRAIKGTKNTAVRNCKSSSSHIF